MEKLTRDPHSLGVSAKRTLLHERTPDDDQSANKNHHPLLTIMSVECAVIAAINKAYTARIKGHNVLFVVGCVFNLYTPNTAATTT